MSTVVEFIRADQAAIRDIDMAQQTIQALCVEFRDALHAKGYAKAYVEIWIGRNGTAECSLFVSDDIARKLPCLVHYDDRRDLYGMVETMREAIAALPHLDAESLAYADELSGPLFLMSEHSPAAE